MSKDFFQVLSTSSQMGDTFNVDVVLNSVGPFISYRGYDSGVEFGDITPATYQGNDILWAFTVYDSRTPEEMYFAFALEGSHPQDLFDWIEPEGGPKYPSVASGPDFFTVFTDFGDYSVWQFTVNPNVAQFWPNSGTRTLRIT